MSVEWSKSRAPRFSAVRTTAQMWGKRKRVPVCAPVPRPIEEETPRVNHQAVYQNWCSSFCDGLGVGDGG